MVRQGAPKGRTHEIKPDTFPEACLVIFAFLIEKKVPGIGVFLLCIFEAPWAIKGRVCEVETHFSLLWIFSEQSSSKSQLGAWGSISNTTFG